MKSHIPRLTCLSVLIALAFPCGHLPISGAETKDNPEDKENPAETAAVEESEETPGIQPDLNRGVILLNAASGQYDERNHFAYWNWDFEAERPGMYEVRLLYTSVRQKKMGIQFRLDSGAVLKSYVYRSKEPDEADEFSLGRAHIPAKGKNHITILTGDKSQKPPFSIKGVKLVPTGEGEELIGQNLGGAIELHARDAATHAVKMQYEHKPEKNCLGFWIHPEDWAEWKFHVSTPGRFSVSLVYGCGNKSGGSEVALLTSDDQILKFTVKETGGFQNWETLDLGTVELREEGFHKIAVQPLSKPGTAVMDIRKIVLTPVK